MNRLTSSYGTGASEALDVASRAAQRGAHGRHHVTSGDALLALHHDALHGALHGAIRAADFFAHHVARRVVLGLVLLSAACGSVALSAPALAAKGDDARRHPGYVDGSGFARLAGEDSELVEVNIGPSLLKAIARGADDDPEARSVLSGLLSVNAYIVELDSSAATVNRATKMIAEIVDSLERSGWERVVKVRDRSETVNVYVRNGDVTIDGLVVLVFDREDKEVVFVNLVGSIDLARLGELEDTLDIPGLDAIGDVGDKAPVPSGATPAPKPGQNQKGEGSRGDGLRGDAMQSDATRGDAVADATSAAEAIGDAP